MATRIQRRIDRTVGQRRNMNGAGRGGRLVTRRSSNGKATAGRTQIGNREQRRNDLRAAFGVRG